jgi:hypothetical protein
VISKDGKQGKEIMLNASGDKPVWATLGVKDVLELRINKTIIANCISAGEFISKGQNIAKGKIVLLNGNEMVHEVPFTTIGRKRILSFPCYFF